MAKITQVQTIKQVATDNLLMRNALERFAVYLASEQMGLEMTSIQRRWIYQEVQDVLGATRDPYKMLENCD